MKAPPKRNPGEPVRASDLNAHSDAVRALASASGGNGIGVKAASEGLIITNRDNPFSYPVRGTVALALAEFGGTFGLFEVGSLRSPAGAGLDAYLADGLVGLSKDAGGPIAVALESFGGSGPGRIQLGGVAVAMVKKAAGVTGPYAELDGSGALAMQDTPGPARVLVEYFAADPTAPHFALIAFGSGSGNAAERIRNYLFSYQWTSYGPTAGSPTGLYLAGYGTSAAQYVPEISDGKIVSVRAWIDNPGTFQPLQEGSLAVYTREVTSTYTNNPTVVPPLVWGGKVLQTTIANSVLGGTHDCSAIAEGSAKPTAISDGAGIGVEVVASNPITTNAPFSVWVEVSIATPL